jgi:hypothetical protein
MNDQRLPMFEEPSPPSTADAPKKQRRKPVKRRNAADYPRTKAQKAVVKKRRKRRVSKSPVLAAPYGKDMGVTAEWSNAASNALGALMQLPIPARRLVLAVAQGLSK